MTKDLRACTISKRVGSGYPTLATVLTVGGKLVLAYSNHCLTVNHFRCIGSHVLIGNVSSIDDLMVPKLPAQVSAGISVQWHSKALRGPGSTVTWGSSHSLPSNSPFLPFPSPFPSSSPAQPLLPAAKRPQIQLGGLGAL